MEKVILVVILVTAGLAAKPIPSQVFTVKVVDEWSDIGSMVVSAEVPSDSILFEDEKEVLASITSFSSLYWLQSIGMTTVTSIN